MTNSCDYCGTTTGVRILYEGLFYRGKTYPASLVCERCFISQDDGPCFDDLPTVEEKDDDQ